MWAPSVPFHSPFIQMAQGQGKGGAGYGHRQGEAHSSEEALLPAQEVPGVLEGKKARDQRSDLTHLRQRVTDGRGPFLTGFWWSTG